MAPCDAPAPRRRRVIADAPAISPEGTCVMCGPSHKSGSQAGPNLSVLGAIRSRERGGSAAAASTSLSAPTFPYQPPSTSPSLLLASARFSSLRLAASLDAAAMPSVNPNQPPPFFARRRSKIVEAASASVSDGNEPSPSGRSSSSTTTTTTLLLALTAAGGCAAFCRHTGELLTHLNASGDDVIRSIFLNRSRKEVIAVSVCRGDAFASLRCRALPLAAIASCRGLSSASSSSALLAAASRALFEEEELHWPGFVEFDDVNGVVLTRCGGNGSGGSGGGGRSGGGGGSGGANASSNAGTGENSVSSPPNYAIHDLSDYSLRFRVDGTGVREVRTAPGLLLLVMEPRSAAPPPTTTTAETSTSTTHAVGGVPCRLLSITDGTLLASFDAPAPPGGGGRLDFIELFGHTLLVGGGTPPTLTRVDVRKASSSVSSSASTSATDKAKKSIAAAADSAASPPAPFPTPSAFIFLHEARLFLAFGGEQRASTAAGANSNSSSLLPSSSVVVCDSAGTRIRSLDGAVSVGSARSPGGPAANSVYVTADQQFIVSYSSRAAAATTAVPTTTTTAAAAAPTSSSTPSPAVSRQGSVATNNNAPVYRGRCSCGGSDRATPGGGSASASPATSSGGQQQQELIRRRRQRSTSTSASSEEDEEEEELEEEEEEEEIGGVITVSHVLSGRCVARLSAKMLRTKSKKASVGSKKRAKLDDDDDDDESASEVDLEKANDAVRRALSDVSALFYDEETGDLVTGSADGLVHVWSNNHG